VKPEGTGLHLYDPRDGDVSLEIETFTETEDLAGPQRTNYFSIYWVQEGEGAFWAELGHHCFCAGSLLFVVPYQCFRVIPEGRVRGVAIRFHANFLCIETQHEEIGCNGVLFNDIYGVPVVQLDESHAHEFAALLDEMGRELRECNLAHSDVLLSYLKIFLVRATRLKLQQQNACQLSPARMPAMLGELKVLIERHYRSLHTPADYAELLCVAPKSLARLVKTHLHKTLTELIRERLMKQAKWELLHTLKPVKQVAAELGFEDVFYFSRLFKKAAGCSPSFFREYETTIREGRNLSMR
jgi:AraC-like DNA-binding protein